MTQRLISLYAFGPEKLLFTGLQIVAKYWLVFKASEALFCHQMQQVHEQLLLGFSTARVSTHQAPLQP